MRLYVSKKEIPTLKNALEKLVLTDAFDSKEFEVAKRLLERVELCEELQDNEDKARCE